MVIHSSESQASVTDCSMLPPPTHLQSKNEFEEFKIHFQRLTNHYFSWLRCLGFWAKTLLRSPPALGNSQILTPSLTRPILTSIQVLGTALGSPVSLLDIGGFYLGGGGVPTCHGEYIHSSDKPWGRRHIARSDTESHSTVRHRITHHGQTQNGTLPRDQSRDNNQANFYTIGLLKIVKSWVHLISTNCVSQKH